MFMILNINNNKFKVKTLHTFKDKSEGMMNKNFDESFNGLLFTMTPGKHCFWMKSCIINLDIIFIKDNIITKIHHNCSPCTSEECENYCGIGDLILEIKGGLCKKLNINVGDKIRYKS